MALRTLEREGDRAQHSHLLVVGREPPLTASHLQALTGHYVIETIGSHANLRDACERHASTVLLISADEIGVPLTVLLQEVRSWSSVPMLVLSERASENDKVAALETGADDYMVPPIGAAELLARIRVALRHAGRVDPTPIVRAGDIEIRSGHERRVVRAGREVRLSRTEYELLLLMAAHPDKLLTYRMLIETLWGSTTEKSREHMLHVYMARLRTKLEQDPAHPQHLITEGGAGYRLATLPAGVA